MCVLGYQLFEAWFVDGYNSVGETGNLFPVHVNARYINTEFRNRVREVRDLLWNSDQAFTLIDEYAALLRGPTNAPTILDADRSMWDYNPKMISTVYSDNPASKAN